jgi:hypothetical protein
MTTTGDGAFFAIVFMTGGVLLTVLFFGAAALVVVGHFKPSVRMRRAGWIALAIWSLPAAIWCYYLLTFTERDQYRTLSEPEVVYGVPLPAGALVNFRKWARRVQWANLPAPQIIQGVEYVSQVNLCGRNVCSGTLARDQDIQGLPCRAQTVVSFSETTGRLTECNLARPLLRHRVTWPAGTVVRIGSDQGDSYLPDQGAPPIRVGALLVHSGLMIRLTNAGRIRELDRNFSRAAADTYLEVGDIILQSDAYHFHPDGTIQGAVLARDAVINGKPMKAGEPVVIHQPDHR